MDAKNRLKRSRGDNSMCGKLGDIISYDNIFWEIISLSKINKYSNVIVARRCKVDGSLGKEKISYDTSRIFETIHRYKH